MKTKKEALWFGGLNEKTVKSMSGTDKREVCIQLGKQNLQMIQNLINELSTDSVPHIEVSIYYRGKTVTLSESESLLIVNAMASMKLTIQGGAWSEVGKKSEKRLLFTIFEMLGIPSSQYILVFSDIRNSSVDNPFERRTLIRLVISKGIYWR